MTTFTPITLNADALSLLTAAGLPVADLEDGMSRVFVGGYEEDELVGVVGVELHLPAGLLRSLAVARRKWRAWWPGWPGRRPAS